MTTILSAVDNIMENGAKNPFDISPTTTPTIPSASESTLEEPTIQKRETTMNGPPNKSSTSTTKTSTSLYEYPDRYARHIPEDKDQALIKTPMGSAMVYRTRRHPTTHEIISRDLQLLDWKQATPKKGPPRPVMMYTTESYPSIDPEIGSQVLTQFGRGTVTELRPSTDQVVVQISNWRLAGRSRVTCCLAQTQVQVVRPKKQYEMNVFERVELAHEYKDQARQLFLDKQYEPALQKYAQAVDAVRYIQHKPDSTNHVRADLLVVMITCCNNAATTCVASANHTTNTSSNTATTTSSSSIQDPWNMVQRYAQNALVLMEALEAKHDDSKPSKIMQILQHDGYTPAKIFGEWKSKSLLCLAKAQVEKHNYAQAVAYCKQVYQISEHYNSSNNNKTIQQCSKECRQLHGHCKEQQILERKKEKQRAQAMFGGNSSTTEETVDNKEEGATTANNSNANANANTHTKTMKKAVTFEDGGTPRDAYSPSNSTEDDEDDDDDNFNDYEDALPWYQEHQELLVLLGGMALVGLGATQFLLRSSSHSRR